MYTKVPIWAQLPELPTEFHNLAFLRKIGDTLGVFISADLKATGRNQMRFARVLVTSDVSAPMKKIVRLGNISQEVIWDPPPCGVHHVLPCVTK